MHGRARRVLIVVGGGGGAALAGDDSVGAGHTRLVAAAERGVGVLRAMLSAIAYGGGVGGADDSVVCPCMSSHRAAHYDRCRMQAAPTPVAAAMQLSLRVLLAMSPGPLLL